ncbi:MAG TPA: response regulator, partial [Puia sp.]|nr:response regulator [Puia sp.]
MLKCIIIDDHIQSVQVLKNFIRKTSFLEFAGSFADSGSAMKFLNNHPVELIFLDIKKSGPSAFHQVDIFQQAAQIILISENRKFALDGFDLGVVDFMVKPLTFERFCKSVERVHKFNFLSRAGKITQSAEPLKGGYIFIKEATRHV